MPYLSIIGFVSAAVGLVGLLAMVCRKMLVLAKLPEENLAPFSFSLSSLKEKIKSKFGDLRYSSWRAAIFSWLEKTLRKARVFLLKIDNIALMLISRARESSQTWSIRSRAWLEHHRLKKKQKLQVLEELDKLEVSESLQKAKKKIEAERDKVFQRKIEEVASISQALSIEASVAGNNNFAQREKEYIERIARDPKDTEAYRDLGFLYLKQKNFSDARSCFRQILKLDPEDEEIKRELKNIEERNEV